MMEGDQEVVNNCGSQKQKTHARKRKHCSDQVDALDKLKAESCSHASKVNRLPKTPIQNKTLADSGTSRVVCSKLSSKDDLKKANEEKLETWILDCYRRGFNKLNAGLIYSAKMIVEQQSNKDHQFPFGKGWHTGFRKRHPEVLKKHESCRTVDENLTQWFITTKEILDEDNARNALRDPARIFIMEELILKFGSENELMFWSKTKATEETNTSELSFLFAADAVGDIAPPFVISKSDLSHFSEMDNWRSETSDEGLINCDIFLNYMVNTFYPYLTGTCSSSFPVVVFFGCDFPYLSMPLCEFCQSKKISLICLPRNSKSIPSIDTIFFEELNKDWEHLQLDSNIDQKSLEIYVLSILQDSITEGLFQRRIIQRFQMNGIYPFNSQNGTRKSFGKVSNHSNHQTRPAVDYLESKISPDILSQFNYCRYSKISWNGAVEFTALYELWLAVVEENEIDDSDPDDEKSSEIETDEDEEV